MARQRQIDSYPDYWVFHPLDRDEAFTEVVMTLDEYEVIRLLDYEGLTQEQCAAKLSVARTTVTGIYENARKKMATMLVEGRGLRLAGGRYELRGCLADPNEQNRLNEGRTGKGKRKQKGEQKMRVAVTFKEGEIFQHFGHSEKFKVYEVEDGKVVAEQILDASGSGHGALAGLLKSQAVDALICGGIGPGAQNALAEAGIELFAGVTGAADAAVEAWLAGKLTYQTEANCNHHGEQGHHHGEGHSCGHHGEGHSCGH
ncbi:MAG: NifB/NifX family molybdenum-iron cluster-binding protein [Eubacteriales bacterium]|nr:NifB/NifX family molybdenum-iron cluster-binding protein [Eubacteriales bacterium]